MIKSPHILAILFLSGCSTFDLDSVKGLANTFSKEDVLTPALSNSFKDRIILNLNNNRKEIFISYPLNASLYKWSNDEYHSLISYNGKLMKSYGYKNNFNIIYNSSFDINLYLDGRSISAFISLDNPPSGLLEINYNYNLIRSGTAEFKSGNGMIEYLLIEESFDVPKIHWKGKNYYWLDKDQRVLKSKQIINPNNDKIHYSIIR